MSTGTAHTVGIGGPPASGAGLGASDASTNSWGEVDFLSSFGLISRIHEWRLAGAKYPSCAANRCGPSARSLQWSNAEAGLQLEPHSHPPLILASELKAAGLMNPIMARNVHR